MKINLKKEKGFTTVDVSIAMIVTVLFVTIMSSVMYSVYLASTEARRTATALNYAVDIFEYIGMADFGEVYEDGVLKNIENLDITGISSTSEGATGKIGTYDIKVKITDPIGDNLVKLITLTITYPVSAKNTEKIELQRIKTIS